MVYSLIASISLWNCNGHIIPTFIVHHIRALHLHKSLHYHTSTFSMLFCSDNCIHSIFIICTSYSLIFLCKKKGGEGEQKRRAKRKSQPCWDYTPISLKKKGMLIQNHVNMVPNAWLTRKMMALRASPSHNYIFQCIA